jgi:hypothetical protein
MEGTLGRECARLSRGLRGTGLGGLRATAWARPHSRARRRRQGCQRRTDSIRTRGKRTPSRAIRRTPKWEPPREARFPPVSFASGGPEPPDACLPVSGRASSTRSRRSRGRARSRKTPGRERPSSGAERPRPRCRSLRREATEHECSSWNGFGVQKSIGRTAGRDARGRYQAPRGHARPRSKETQGPGQGACDELERRRCADHAHDS